MKNAERIRFKRPHGTLKQVFHGVKHNKYKWPILRKRPYEFMQRFCKKYNITDPYEIKLPQEAYYEDWEGDRYYYTKSGDIIIYTDNKRVIKLIKKYDACFSVNSYDIWYDNPSNLHKAKC